MGTAFRIIFVHPVEFYPMPSPFIFKFNAKVGVLFVWPFKFLEKKTVPDFASHVYIYLKSSVTDFSR